MCVEYTHILHPQVKILYIPENSALFNETLSRAEALGFPRVARANSSTLLPPDDDDDYVRPGLALYGGKLRSMSDIECGLSGNDGKLVLNKSRHRKGTQVSYGGTWVAQTYAACHVAMGYADGLPRALSIEVCFIAVTTVLFAERMRITVVVHRSSGVRLACHDVLRERFFHIPCRK